MRLRDLLVPGDQDALRGLLGPDGTHRLEHWQFWPGTLEDAVRLSQLELIVLRPPWNPPCARLTRLGWIVATSEDLKPSFWASYLR